MNKINNILKESFIKYLNTSARSNEKLKILHGYIANSIKEKLNDNYRVDSINTNKGKEEVITGNYMPKKVDITISKIVDNKPVHIAGVAVKFVMSNYFQNSNNYFENMLGETSNIRKAGIPYFQIFIIDHWLPYFDKKKNISKWEEITSEKLSKYKKLSFEDVINNLFVPSKMFLHIVNKKFNKFEIDDLFKCKDLSEYKDFCLKNDFKFVDYKLENFEYGEAIILNDYGKFINYIVDEIKKYH
ncbi:Uncharacterised protein [Metamycoplasma cloacale]|uniref:Uncharacterized protein n=1 Tax=Metamycoplasma cloacale TaxID=92401 RepID=A0A2Z4LM70_9BACT|nr:hypothetical protein [Metamycoplasma cloacale]AWX42839.1 hypothetical protein DK849_02055 [Metamycoplasma cloacale]VEU79340.1 Uncharacterised protein [Metamycoplasma cloacale]